MRKSLLVLVSILSVNAHAESILITDDVVVLPGVSVSDAGVTVNTGNVHIDVSAQPEKMLLNFKSLIETVNYQTQVLRVINLSGKDFSNAKLKNIDFSYADLTGTNFSNAKLTNVTFQYAQLNNADFSHTKMKNCDLRESSIDGASFAHAKLYQQTKIAGVDFSVADTSHTKMKATDSVTIIVTQ